MARFGLISPGKDEICYIMLKHLFDIYETLIDYSYQKTREGSIKLSELQASEIMQRMMKMKTDNLFL